MCLSTDCSATYEVLQASDVQLFSRAVGTKLRVLPLTAEIGPGEVKAGIQSDLRKEQEVLILMTLILKRVLLH